MGAHVQTGEVACSGSFKLAVVGEREMQCDGGRIVQLLPPRGVPVLREGLIRRVTAQWCVMETTASLRDCRSWLLYRQARNAVDMITNTSSVGARSHIFTPVSYAATMSF